MAQKTVCDVCGTDMFPCDTKPLHYNGMVIRVCYQRQGEKKGKTVPSFTTMDLCYVCRCDVLKNGTFEEVSLPENAESAGIVEEVESEVIPDEMKGDRDY